jgi:16S rRNA (uracil1498-N3)-methyltransferase
MCSTGMNGRASLAGVAGEHGKRTRRALRSFGKKSGKLLRRFLVRKIEAGVEHLTIEGSEARHIHKVLRMGEGDQLTLMDEEGTRFEARILRAGAGSVQVRLERRLPAPPFPPLRLVLCQALLKSGPMDYVVQKTSELGTSCIFPFTSERTVVKLDRSRSENKARHLRKIAQNAAKQANRYRPLEIGPIMPLKELVGRWKEDRALKLLFWEQEGTQDLKRVIRAAPPSNKVILIIGPEGGLGRAETSFAVDAGFVSISLGRRILRAETAAIVSVGIIQYEWGDLSLIEPEDPSRSNAVSG